MLFDSVFQAGNVITLAIVVIILAIYRQMDKDNRSLEKVKKFTSRMKDEIGAYVDEKSREMQNLAIELDVHQKTAKEILNRLGKAEEAIEERSGMLDAVKARIDGYDQNIGELQTMTGKVEENLKRIAAESQFVDTVARRVKAVSSQLDGVEKSIPQIEKNLHNKASASLEELKQEMIKGIYDDIGRLKKETRDVGSNLEEFSSTVTSLQERQSDSERESLEALRNAADEVMTELDRTRENLEQEYAEHLETTGQAMEEQVRERIQAAAAEGRNLEGEILESLTEYIEGRVGEIRAETASWKVRAEDTIRDQRSGLEELLSGTDRRLDTYREEAEERFARAEAVSGRMEQLEQQLNATVDKATARFNEELGELSETLATVRDDERSRAEAEIREMRERMEQRVEEINARIAEAAENGRNLEGEVLASLREYIDGRVAEVRDETAAWKGDAEEQIAAERGQLEEMLTGIDGRLEEFGRDTDERFSRAEAVSGRMEKLEEQLNATVARATDRFKQELGELSGSLSAVRSEERTRAEAEIQAMRDRMDQTVEEINARIAEAAEDGRNLEGEVLASLREYIDGRVAEVKNETSAWKSGAEEQIATERGQLEEMLTGIDSRLEEFGRDTEERFSRAEAVSGRMEKLEEKLNATVAKATARFRQELGELSGSLSTVRADERARTEAEMQEMRGLMDRTSEEITLRIKAAGEDSRSVEDEVISTLRTYIDETSAAARDELLVSLDATKTEIGGAREELSRLFNDLKGSTVAWKDEAEGVLEGHRLGLQKKISDLEGRLLEYEEDTGYRFSRIEEITRDMDQLEENLRGSMDRVSARIRKEFADFSTVLASEREEERQKANDEMSTIQAAMGELEEGLNQLKEGAYDSVSEKLKLFEDDFFTDLRERNAAMQDQFQEWKEKVRAGLDKLGEEAEEKRTETESRYSLEMNERLETVQNEMQGRLQGFEEQVTSFYDRVEQKIATTETDMKALEDGIRQDVEEARRQSRASFETIFTDHDTSIKDQLKKSEREYQGELKRMGDDLADGRKEFSALLEGAKSDVTVWQAQVLQQLKEAESKVGEDISGLKLATTENTAALVKAYTEEQEELVQNSQAERTRIRTEIKNLNDEVTELQNELRRRSEEAIARQSRESEQVLADLQKLARELLIESEGRLKEFRISAADLKEKVEGVHKKLVGKIDDQYKIQTVKLQEIDKRQKSFVNQTKIFDRADSLKVSLEENLEDLKSEITRVDAMAKEIKESERKFLKVQKLGEEVSSKFARFLSERSRIEEMEGDFKKLINLSQAIDSKLTDVTASHDTLTSVQAQLRQLEELEDEVAVKYERLESKGNIIEVTASGVDKNFQTLRELEGRSKEIGSTLKSLPRELEAVKEGIRSLATDKERADETMEKLSNLDTVMKEIEERTDKLQEAREWLARTETRLQEVGKQAQEQVKLLGSIMKEENRRSGKEKSASNLGAREVVTKLAHQGWSVEEIARATKLSRGEVELILELLPKKG